MGDSAETLTVSVTWPTSSLASTRATELSVTGTPGCSNERNPFIVTLIVYVPDGTR